MVGDLDCDGWPDIVSVHEDSHQVRVGIGTNAPDRWVAHTLACGSIARQAEDVDLGDANGNGRLDVVMPTTRPAPLFRRAHAEGQPGGPASGGSARCWPDQRAKARRLTDGMPWFRPHALELDVTEFIRPGSDNRITVRVLCNFDVWGANGIYERMFLYAKK